MALSEPSLSERPAPASCVACAAQDIISAAGGHARPAAEASRREVGGVRRLCGATRRSRTTVVFVQRRSTLIDPIMSGPQLSLNCGRGCTVLVYGTAEGYRRQPTHRASRKEQLRGRCCPPGASCAGWRLSSTRTTGRAGAAHRIRRLTLRKLSRRTLGSPVGALPLICRDTSASTLALLRPMILSTM